MSFPTTYRWVITTIYPQMIHYNLSFPTTYRWVITTIYPQIIHYNLGKSDSLQYTGKWPQQNNAHEWFAATYPQMIHYNIQICGSLQHIRKRFTTIKSYPYMIHCNIAANESLQHSSVQFRPYTNWVVGGTGGTIHQKSSSSLFCTRPSWAVPASAGMSTLWCCPSSISPANHGIANPPRWPLGWFLIGCCCMWHAWTMQVSVSRQVKSHY